MGVIARQRGMDPRQIDNRSDRANKVIVWHRFIETKKNRKAALGLGRADPSSSASALDHLKAGESRFAVNFNGLLQYNRPLATDIAPQPNVRF
jgi:hypothetical protein